MEQLTKILLDVVNQPQVTGIIALIGFDIVTGVASAIRNKVFQWRKLFDFYVTEFIPYLLVYLAAHTIGALVQVNADTLGPMAEPIAWLLTNSWMVVMGKLGLSILTNVQELGINFPKTKDEDVPPA